MKTLIVPCLGRKIVNKVPQYLVRHPNGQLLIERSLSRIFAETYDKIIIVLLKSDVEQYNAKNIILDELQDRYIIDVKVLDQMTSGPAETIYKTLVEENISGCIVIKDSDTYIEIEEPLDGNFVVGLDLNECPKDIRDLKSKSFLILNEQKNILDIIEKKIKSDVICIGLYGFSKAEKFIEAYKKLSDGSYPIKGLYISHIISYLIGYNRKVFRYINAKEYENWGDERLWNDLQRDYTMYFIDLDNILGPQGTLSESHKIKLETLQERGAYFIGYTTYDEGYKISALQTLEDAGLKFIKIIYGCPYSFIKEIIDTDEVLERKVIEL